MRKGLLPVVGLVVIVAIALIPLHTVIFAAAASLTGASRPSLHVFQSRGSSPQSSGNTHAAALNANVNANASGGSLLTYHGGPVMAGPAHVYAIFWDPNSNMAASYEKLITQYFGDVGSSPLYQNLRQYPQAGGQFPSNATLTASWVDTTTAYPSNVLVDTDIQGEVTHAQNTNNNWSSSINNIFFVFTEKNQSLCIDSSQTACTPDLTPKGGLCAYHNIFGANNTIYAAIPYSASPNFQGGCIAGAPKAAATGSRPNNDDADLTLNITSHEQIEAATDPLLNAWYVDLSNTVLGGFEIGDLCAWTFAPNNAQGADVVWGSDGYNIQQEWDNTINGCSLSGDHTTRYYDIKNLNSHQVLDVDHGGLNPGAQVLQWFSNNGTNQQWTLVPDGPYYQIVNRNSGLILDVYNGGTTQGANIIQWANKHGLNQEWYLEPDGATDLIVNAKTGFVIDIDHGGLTAGAHALQWPGHNATNQQWSFIPVAHYFKIINRNSGQAMDVYNGGLNQGAHVIQWPYKNGPNQMWVLSPSGTSNGVQIYQITNLHSGLVMDVFNGGTTQGANVIQWVNKHGTNQMWKIVPYGSYSQIVNVNSNLVLDVFNGGKVQGVNVIQWANKHGANQQWSLIPVSA